MVIHTYEEEMKYQIATLGQTWWVAAFDIPRQVDKIVEIQQWCCEAFGQPGYHPLTDQMRWQEAVRYGEVRFNNKQDLEWFVLKWS